MVVTSVTLAPRGLPPRLSRRGEPPTAAALIDVSHPGLPRSSRPTTSPNFKISKGPRRAVRLRRSSRCQTVPGPPTSSTNSCSSEPSTAASRSSGHLPKNFGDGRRRHSSKPSNCEQVSAISTARPAGHPRRARVHAMRGVSSDQSSWSRTGARSRESSALITARPSRLCLGAVRRKRIRWASVKSKTTFRKGGWPSQFSVRISARSTVTRSSPGRSIKRRTWSAVSVMASRTSSRAFDFRSGGTNHATR